MIQAFQEIHLNESVSAAVIIQDLSNGNLKTGVGDGKGECGGKVRILGCFFSRVLTSQQVRITSTDATLNYDWVNTQNSTA